MSKHEIQLEWNRTTENFEYKTYNRTHDVSFSGGSKLEVTAAPEYLGDPKITNPEELLVAALSSCFMLTFLSIASNKKFIVDKYVDQATGILGKNAEGKMAVTEVNLNPKIIFSGDNQPDEKTLHDMLEKSHSYCFISNSVKTKVTFKPEMEMA